MWVRDLEAGAHVITSLRLLEAHESRPSEDGFEPFFAAFHSFGPLASREALVKSEPPSMLLPNCALRSDPWGGIRG